MPPLSMCPSCGSELIQPLRWEQREAGEVLVELRCPECLTWMQCCHTPAEMEELDRIQSSGRDELLASYERQVAESMEALAERLHEALEQDLIGPDDFRVTPRDEPERRRAA